MRFYFVMGLILFNHLSIRAHALTSMTVDLELKMGVGEVVQDSLLVTGGEWVAKHLKPYSVRIRSKEETSEGVSMLLELREHERDVPRHVSVTTKWNGPASVESKEIDGRPIYKITVTPRKNLLDDRVESVESRP